MTRTTLAPHRQAHTDQAATPSADVPSIAHVLPTRLPTLADVVGSVAPVGVFLLANAVWGLVAGMLASTAVAATATVARRRRGGGIGWLGLALLGYVLIRGAAGALTGSEQVFFGISVAASMAVAIGVLASAFTTTPVATYLLPVLMAGRLRPETAADPAYRRISAHVTAAWAIAELSVSGWEAWHLQHAGAVDFIAARGLLGWPVMAAVIFLCAFYARFRIEWLQGPAPRVKVQA